MKEKVVDILYESLNEIDFKLDKDKISSMLEIPKDYSNGDFAFPCFFIAKEMKENPHYLARKLRETIKKTPKCFQDIQISGPYLNFFVDRKQLAFDLIGEVKKDKEKFGRENLGKGKKVLIEHTSINPNASPHVGRARNAIIGDSLVRLYKFFNYRPDVHYYVNDVSKQIAMLALAGAEKLKFEEMLKEYVKISKKVENSQKLQDEVFGYLFRFEHENEEAIKQFNKITKTCVDGQRKILKDLGIEYDEFDFESKFIKDSRMILEELKKQKTFHKDREGRFYLDLRGTPIRKKMKVPVLILTRSDGTGLYPLRDIAYTIHKMNITENNIIVLGEDQKLYFNQLEEAMKLLGYKSPRVLHYSFILLSKKGKSKKMATRKGDVVLLEDFLADAVDKAKEEIKKRKTKGDAKKVGIGAIKYKILKNGPDKSILFDLDEALSFEGNTGPYLLYSYARANSIIKKSKKGKKKEQEEIIELKESETKLVMKLSEFSKVARRAFDEMNPSLVANYSYDLAQIFNEFYHDSQVVGGTREEFRLKLVASFKQVLENALGLLGIETLDEM